MQGSAEALALAAMKMVEPVTELVRSFPLILLLASALNLGCESDSDSSADDASMTDGMSAQDGEANSSEGGAGANDGGLPSLAIPEGGMATEELPDFNYLHIGAVAVVEVDGREYKFDGYSAEVWSTWSQASEENTIGDDAVVAQCSLLSTTDNKLVAGADFNRYFNREAHNSFSFSSDGDSTVIWGLHDAEMGQEWSAAGGPPVMAAPIIEDDSFIIGIRFNGEATENFSTDKSPVQSVVYCLYKLRE